MKCSKCGYRAKDIAHMAAHYRKAHPATMKKTHSKAVRMAKKGGGSMSGVYCSHCGKWIKV